MNMKIQFYYKIKIENNNNIYPHSYILPYLIYFILTLVLILILIAL